MEKVSVIIPTYNRANNIERAINSVLNQTYDNIEIIVVDDNSNNSECRKEMIKIMKKYSNNEKVIYLKHEKNKNGAAARNTGINNSTGEYITFLDDDDYFMPNRIEIIVNELEKNKKYGGAYTGYAIVKNKNIINITNSYKKGKFDYELLQQYSFFGTGSNMFFKAAAVKNINGFDESFNRNQDLEFMIRFFQKYQILNIPNILVIKNIDDQSNSKSFQKIFDSRMIFLDKFQYLINKYDISKKNIIYETNFINLINFSFKSENVKKNYQLCKKKMKEYKIYISFKKRILILCLFINSKLKIKKIIYDRILMKKIKEHPQYKNIIQFINKIENN